MNKKLITVFTPTFNRAHTLRLGYKSLKNQTSKNFIWLIIDDGSTDNTESLVASWLLESNDFEIQYYKKENGGLHTGYNLAFEKITTELCVCIDSDDYMPDNAIQLIEDFWNEHRSTDIAGFIARDAYRDGRLIGSHFPDIERIHIVELVDKYKFKNDTKIVLRTECIKKFSPQPTFEGEKNFNPIYMLLLADYQYPFKVMNEILCYVEYAPDGMTHSIMKQYLNSPNSFALLRLAYINSPHSSLCFKIRNYIHLGSSMLLSKNFSFINQTPCPALLLLLLPLSSILTLYIKFSARFKS